MWALILCEENNPDRKNDGSKGDWFGGAPDKTYGLHRKPREVELALDMRTIPSGVYFLRLRVGGQARTQKFTVTR